MHRMPRTRAGVGELARQVGYVLTKSANSCIDCSPAIMMNHALFLWLARDSFLANNHICPRLVKAWSLTAVQVMLVQVYGRLYTQA